MIIKLLCWKHALQICGVFMHYYCCYCTLNNSLPGKPHVHCLMQLISEAWRNGCDGFTLHCKTNLSTSNKSVYKFYKLSRTLFVSCVLCFPTHAHSI